MFYCITISPDGGSAVHVWLSPTVLVLSYYDAAMSAISFGVLTCDRAKSTRRLTNEVA